MPGPQNGSSHISAWQGSIVDITKFISYLMFAKPQLERLLLHSYVVVAADQREVARRMLPLRVNLLPVRPQDGLPRLAVRVVRDGLRQDVLDPAAVKEDWLTGG